MSLVDQNFEIILASTSKVRKEILEAVGLEFLTISPDFDEEEAKKTLNLKSPELALALAKGKALSISKKHPNSYVIGSDQVCEFEGMEVSKSRDISDVKNQLKKFNNKIHFQNNAVIVAFDNQVIFENSSLVKLKMRDLSDDEIIKYADFDQPIGCAGSYKYESLGKHLFEEVEGDYYSVLGLSIQPLLSFFHKQNIIKFR